MTSCPQKRETAHGSQTSVPICRFLSENIARNDLRSRFFFAQECSVQLWERQFAKSYLFHAQPLGSPRPGRRKSPGRNPKSLKKSRKSPRTLGPQSLKKVSGRVRKVSKKSKNGFFETFRTLPETFFRLLGPEGPRTFSRLFSDFWGFGPETLPPRPGRSQG